MGRVEFAVAPIGSTVDLTLPGCYNLDTAKCVKTKGRTFNSMVKQHMLYSRTYILSCRQKTDLGYEANYIRKVTQEVCK